ncbi:MAG: putative flippase AglR [Methanosaeta sp. PtaU1.Bin112]|nr:MAG: putative flippase AglR [Methanosaeta sp. PtaU1.Bin112]
MVSLLYQALQNKRMQEAKKFALDVSHTFIASIINMLLVFVISIILARHLGADDLGLYRLTYTFYGVATMVGALGIPVAVIKYVAEYKDDRANFDKVVSAAIITSIIAGFIIIIIILIVSNNAADIFRMPQMESQLILLSPVFPFILVNAVLYGVLNGLRKMKTYAIALILQQTLMTAFTVILIYYELGVSGAIISIVISSIGVCAYLFYNCKSYIHLILDGYLETTRKLTTFGAKMFGANLINMINLQADVVFLGYFLTATNVGYYSAATGLSKFFLVVPQAIQTVSYPATSEYWAKKDMLGLQNMIDKSVRYSALALMPAGLAIVFFAEEIVVRIYGQGFQQSALPLQILLLGTVIFGVACTSIGGSLAGINRPDLSLKAAGISATANVILNVTLIPRFEVPGAALATCTSLIIMTLLFGLMTLHTLSIKINIKWLAMMIIAALIGFAMFASGTRFLNQYLLGSIILVIYTGLALRIILKGDEIDKIISIIKSRGKNRI